MGHHSSGIPTIFENTQHISDAVLGVVAGIAHISEKPLLDEGFLFLSQPFYLLREIRNGEVQENRRGSGDETLCASDWSSTRIGGKLRK